MIVLLDDIEGGNGLPLDSNALSDQLQSVVKAFKRRNGNNDTKNNPPLKYFHGVIGPVNETENDNKTQTR